MNFLKWGLSVILSCALLGVPAAAETEEKTAAQAAPTFDKVQVHVELTKEPDGEGELTFGLYAAEEEAVDTETVVVKENDRSFNMEFSVPEYEIGAIFLLKLESGAAAMGLIEPAYRELHLQTYVWNKDGEPAYQTTAYVNMEPRWERGVRVRMGVQDAPAPYYPINDDVYVSDGVFTALGITAAKTEDYIFLHAETGDCSMQFFRDNIFACRGGVGYNLSSPVFCQGDTWYLPLSEVGTYFACSYTKEVTDREIVHTVWRSAYALLAEEEVYVNSLDIESRTDYLIWISKKDFMVHVYLGANQSWEIVKSFPCTLGTPQTPTIEGEFEYIERLDRWTYPDYYCGPVMRFYRGYALHSTLIRYDGTPYDDRVGMQLSLGCIRLHPEDIDWLISHAPLYTKILITP